MESIMKTICCGVVLTLLQNGSVAGEITDSTPDAARAARLAQSPGGADASILVGDDNGFVSSDQKIPVVAQPEDVDEAKVEKRLEERSIRTEQRIADAEKDVADRNKDVRQHQEGNAAR